MISTHDDPLASSQVQFDPMTGQWVSMGPLIDLMQLQQMQSQYDTAEHDPSRNMMPPYPPGQAPHTGAAFPQFANEAYNMVGYNLAAPPAGMMGARPLQAMDRSSLAGAEGTGPAGEAPAAAPAPERVTVSQVFSWQVGRSREGCAFGARRGWMKREAPNPLLSERGAVALQMSCR